MIFNKQTISGIAQFRVRAHVVLNALLKLKEINIYYKSVTISYENIAKLPVDGDCISILQNINIDSSDDDNDICENSDFIENNVLALENMDHEQYISKELHLNYPSTSSEPINEFNSEGYIASAFPTLFPTGNADFLQPRIIPLTRNEYFKHLMEFKDGRFAKDPRFRFYALNTVMRHNAISMSNLCMRDIKEKNCTVNRLREMIKNDSSILGKIIVYSSSIKSSKGYWTKRCSELKNMVQQLGKPTIFFTLSAADYHWPDLFGILCPEKRYEEISDDEKRKLMHDNPLLVGYFFQHRVNLFVEHVLKKVFNVKDYWYRFEWQSRGSPHIHGVLWLRDEPNYDINSISDEQLQLLTEYFNKLCTAVHPSLNNEKSAQHPSQTIFSDVPETDYIDDLSNLINTFQRHTKCGSYCLKKVDGKLQCRFHFPHDLQETAHINNNNGYYQFIPQRHDPLIQRYNKILTLIWRANTDFSPIVDMNAIIKYIVKYATKNETSSKKYLEIIENLCKNDKKETPAKKHFVTC